MKQFITLQVGYTWSKMYGLTSKYFTTIVINGDKITSFNHYGMYGSQERINRAMEEKGYKSLWIPSDYGMMTRKDVNNNLFISEEETLKMLKETKQF